MALGRDARELTCGCVPRCSRQACCRGWGEQRSTEVGPERAEGWQLGPVAGRPGAAPSTRRGAAAAAAAEEPGGAGQCSRVEDAAEGGEVPDPVADGGDDAA